MYNFMEKIFEAYENEYGEGEKIQDGETQVFLLQDCTVTLTLGDGKLSVNVTANPPIKCDFASGIFKKMESENNMTERETGGDSNV